VQLFSIGYAGRTPDELIAKLKEHAVDRVIDVRALPLSRRRGFSKTPLRTALAARGVDYVHVRSAGNPYRNDDADLATIMRRYRTHLQHRPDGLTDVLEAARDVRAALLCTCETHGECHRGVIADELAQHVHLKVTEL
jgi:uncharacterized protein (DUF488 family)